MITWKKYLEQRQTLNPRIISALRRTAAAHRTMSQPMTLSDVINLIRNGSQGYVPFVTWAKENNFQPNHPIDYILNFYSQQS